MTTDIQNKNHNWVGEEKEFFVSDGDVLLIVPPFAADNTPSFAAHLLQNVAKETGMKLSVLYANLLFAAMISFENYRLLFDHPITSILAEMVFAKAAYGRHSLGLQKNDSLSLSRLLIQSALQLPPEVAVSLREPTEVKKESIELIENIFVFFLNPELETSLRVAIIDAEKKVFEWMEKIMGFIERRSFKIVGCTCCSAQINASVFLLNEIKKRFPHIVTIIGGANCEGEMAEGMALLSPCIDYVFSGEGEKSFLNFLSDIQERKEPPNRIIAGEISEELNELPLPDYKEYFEQLSPFIQEGAVQLENCWVLYESSRGCWWGQKHQCTFCGLNGKRMLYREKKDELVLRDIRRIMKTYPGIRINMTDNIMPFRYFDSLLLKLGKIERKPLIFYEEKSNLDFDKLIRLYKAGIRSFQAGIEALDTDLLKLMDKGVLARNNLLLLRNARILHLDIHWNLLWGFPGDKAKSYEETLKLVRLIHHLQPPGMFGHVSLDRFSRYHTFPDQYAVKDLTPLPVYRHILPGDAEIDKLAYRFRASYDCESHRNTELILELYTEIREWQGKWSNEDVKIPVLQLVPHGEYYLLHDSRGISQHGPTTRVLDEEEASSVMKAARFENSESQCWAIDDRLGVVLDSWYIPLVTSSTETFLKLAGEASERND